MRILIGALAVSLLLGCGSGTADPSATLDVQGTVRFRSARSPASNAPCETGELAWDAAYVYVCVSTNSWRRSALAAY